MGGVERTPDRKVFAQKVEYRDTDTLYEILKRNIAPGLIIHTDMWRVYPGAIERLNTDGYQLAHHTVNHSVEYVAPDWTHINTIEGTWNGIKTNIPNRNYSSVRLDNKLMEFIWRRQNCNNLWNAFLFAIANVRYD